MANDSGRVEALFELAAREPLAMQQLRLAVDDLEAVQSAKVALAQLPPAELRDALRRRLGGAAS